MAACRTQTTYFIRLVFWGRMLLAERVHGVIMICILWCNRTIPSDIIWCIITLVSFRILYCSAYSQTLQIVWATIPIEGSFWACCMIWYNSPRLSWDHMPREHYATIWHLFLDTSEIYFNQKFVLTCSLLYGISRR